MEFAGQLSGVSKDIVTGGYNIMFSTSELPAGVNDIAGAKLTVTAKKYRKKRSLDANAYSWVLLDKMAKALGSTSEEVYEEMLRRYGYPLYDEDENPVIISLKAGIDISALGIHLKLIGEGHVQDKLFKHYKVIRGQSTYDTKEMSTFIDGIVSEAKELGIETLTPEQLNIMKEQWSDYIERNKKDKRV